METVSSAPEAIEFTKDGLLPIWELCDDFDRREELATAYDKLFSAVRGPADWVWYQGDRQEQLVSTDDPNLAMTGCAIRLSGDNVSALEIQLEDLRTGSRSWKKAGDAGNDCRGTVPPGSVVTGMAARITDKKKVYLRLYYQLLSLGRDAAGQDNCLDPNVFHVDFPEETSGWEADSGTSTHNRVVLAGVQMCCTNSNVSGLAGLASSLVMPINSA